VVSRPVMLVVLVVLAVAVLALAGSFLMLTLLPMPVWSLVWVLRSLLGEDHGQIFGLVPPVLELSRLQLCHLCLLCAQSR
jgi:hypothetical protein